MKPKYRIGETIECTAIVGWVRTIYSLIMEDVTEETSAPEFVYGIEEPESGHIHYLTEEEVSN